MSVKKDARIRKAKVLMKRYPTWGWRRINRALREEFGVGLRAKSLSGVKRRK